MSRIITLGPVGFNPRGEYDPSIVYERLDLILYQGVSYVATRTVQGVLPTDTTYWDALGISGADMSDYYTKTEIDAELNEKYEKPQSGIPKTDLSNDVKSSLEKADTSLQEHQDISGKENISNKITTLSENSTDIQYPTAKCVYDYIEAKIGEINTSLDQINGEVI